MSKGKVWVGHWARVDVIENKTVWKRKRDSACFHGEQEDFSYEDYQEALSAPRCRSIDGVTCYFERCIHIYVYLYTCWRENWCERMWINRGREEDSLPGCEIVREGIRFELEDVTIAFEAWGLFSSRYSKGIDIFSYQNITRNTWFKFIKILTRRNSPFIWIKLFA